MKYLKVVDWDKWQTHKKDRGTPPWIKLYRNLFTNPEWIQLTDSEKGQLVSIWIVAADKKGKFSSDARFLQKICMLDDPPNLSKLKSLGFITQVGRHDGSSVEPQGFHVGPPETETETETEQKTPLSGKPDPAEILDYLNATAKRKFMLTPKHRECIKARINEGYDLKLFKQVVDNMVSEWGADGEMMKFLRPITLFGTKMDSYLNRGELMSESRKVVF